jgi:hypothetical protein
MCRRTAVGRRSPGLRGAWMLLAAIFLGMGVAGCDEAGAITETVGLALRIVDVWV